MAVNDTRAGSKRARTDDTSADGDEDQGPVIKFRNYKPLGEDLGSNTVPEPEIPSIEEEVEKRLASTTVELPGDAGVDLLNLAPRKIDWDLKRAIAPKLEKLDRRTQRAIAEIILARVEAEEE
eukprot:m.483543 g.483543  ORF g.483543 m.483543 type:complete len:123 (+) comp22975_c0_seq1:93-461(+)